MGRRAMKQPRPLTITNGRVVLPCGVVSGGVRLVDGLIEAAGEVEAGPGDECVDAEGRLIAPGLVDLGVFAIDKPAFHFGGITRAALMPDQSPPLDYPARVSHIAKSGKPDLWVHPLAAATRGLEGQDLAEIALMKDAGARGIATGRRWIADSGVMLRLLQYAAMLDLVVVSHGAMIRALLSHYLDRPLNRLWQPPRMHNCAHSIVEFTDGPRVLRYADLDEGFH